MEILLTGNLGFIGNYLEAKLMASGHRVIGYDKGDNFPEKQADVVYHLAANSSVYPIIENPQLGLENIELTFNVLEWMRKTKTPRIIFASSHEVYSGGNLYGASKISCEAMIWAYCKTYGIKATIVRLANIYGFNDHADRFMSTVIRLAKENKPISIYGGKKKKLNFVYIDDCLEAFIKSLYREGVYDVNFPTSLSLVSVAKLIIELLGSKSEIVMKPGREGETMIYLPKPSFIEPRIGLREGLKQLI